MKDLNKEARSMIETEVDFYLKNPKTVEERARMVLRAQGIEPNLETVLSFIVGWLMAQVSMFYHVRHKRDISRDEFTELVQLLKRRAFELRQAFISTRIEE